MKRFFSSPCTQIPSSSRISRDVQGSYWSSTFADRLTTFVDRLTTFVNRLTEVSVTQLAELELLLVVARSGVITTGDD